MSCFTDPSLPRYLNPVTGTVAAKRAWYYIDAQGEEVNAVDTGEVFEVVWDFQLECWIRA